MPILRVKAIDFDQPTAQRLFDALCSGEEMKDRSQRLTKSEIEAAIIENEKLKVSEHYIDDPAGQAWIDEQTKVLEKEYLTAPETNEPVIVDGSFYSIPVKDPKGIVVSSYMGIDAGNGNMSFSVRNRNGLDKPIVYEDGGGGWSALSAGANAIMSFFAFDTYAEGRWGCIPPVLLTDESRAPEEAYGNLSLTPAEARRMTDELLAGTGMAVESIYLECDLDTYNPDIETRTAQTANYGYTLKCARMAQGIPCAYEMGGMSNEASRDMYAPSWPYERLTVFITNNGIRDLYWNSPIEITETVVENAGLLSFEAVMEIFKKMAGVVYSGYMLPTDAASYTGELTQSYGIKVNEIRLEFRRVREQNSVENGLLMPVWSFYGHTWRVMESGETAGWISNGRECILTINAVDGSVIDLNKGY